MKTQIFCLQEFRTLKEGEQPSYFTRVGGFLTVNAGTFPALPYPGSEISNDGLTMTTLLGNKDISKDDMDNYINFISDSSVKMDKIYDYVDLVAQGDGAIVAKAGITGSSTSTSRTGPPSTPENVKYVSVDDVGEIAVTRLADKLSHASIMFTFTNPDTVIVKSGPMQIKVTIAGGKPFYIDLATTIKTTVKNQVKGETITTVAALFNPNGLSPLAAPISILIQK